MNRGRPRGSGRWDDTRHFADATLWARLQALRQAEGLDLSHACRRLANRGYWHARDGKYWASNPGRARADPRLSPFMDMLRAGDARNDDPAEVFRRRFYKAKDRRKTKPAFRAECDFWLAVFLRARELSDAGIEPGEAMRQAHDETPRPA